jgi:hypothetical protein
MHMKKLLVTLVTAAAAVCAQEPPAPKVIELKHASAERIRSSSVLRPFVHSVELDPSGRYLVISAQTAARLTAAEELIKRLDVPLKNVELTFHIVAGGPAQSGTGTPIPAELEGVVKQLRSSFSFPSYRLLETAFVRTRDGSDGLVSGKLAQDGKYDIRFRPIRVTEGTPAQVRLDELQLRQHFLVGQTEKAPITDDAFVKADIDVKEGQKVVVGKATLRENALFLIVSANVID